jgi:hypothetical protein
MTRAESEALREGEVNRRFVDALRAFLGLEPLSSLHDSAPQKREPQR